MGNKKGIVKSKDELNNYGVYTLIKINRFPWSTIFFAVRRGTKGRNGRSKGKVNSPYFIIHYHGMKFTYFGA